MKINDYILRGGEDLNALPTTTPSFPQAAEKVFLRWHENLGKDYSESQNYLEIPVDDQNRLFIRAFWEEKPGCRPICYYIGMLIPRTLYLEVHEYYRIHKGLVNISLLDIKAAIQNQCSPLELQTEWRIPHSIIGADFSQLCTLKQYNADAFDHNIQEMCLLISTALIDDWFSRLVIAVNPYRMSSDYNIIISREKPRPEIAPPRPSVTSTTHPAKKNIFGGTKIAPSPCHSDAPEKHPVKSNKKLWGAIFLLALLNIFTIISSSSETKSVKTLKTQKQELEDSYKKLKEEKLELKEKCNKLEIDRDEKDKEIRQLKDENKDLKRKLADANEARTAPVLQVGTPKK